MAQKRRSKTQRRLLREKQKANHARKVHKQRLILFRKFAGFTPTDTATGIDVSDLMEPEAIIGAVLQQRHEKRERLFRKF